MRVIIKKIISIIYIFWGLASPLTAWEALKRFDFTGFSVTLVGLMTLLAGIFGLIGIKKLKCRIFGIVIFVCAATSISVALPSTNVQLIIDAALALLYIACV